MPLNYRNSEVHPATTGIASVAHVFTEPLSSMVFAYCEMADGSTFWCNKSEDRAAAPLHLMFGMQPAAPWIDALAQIPAQLRIAALQRGAQQHGGGAA